MKVFTFFVCLFISSSLGTNSFPSQSFESNSQWTSEMYSEATPKLLLASLSLARSESLEREFVADTFSYSANGFIPEVSPVPVNMILYKTNITVRDGDSGSGKRLVGPTGPFSSSRALGTGYPYQLAGKVFLQHQDGSNWVCSGGIVRKGLVLTAGHCVHPGDGKTTTWYKNIQFVPQYNNGAAPFNVWNSQRSITTGTWYSGGGGVPNGGDWGLLEISTIGNTLIGNYLGYFGWQTGRLVGNHVTMIGYPVSFDNGQIMHQVNSQYARFDSPNDAVYPSDMTGGASGGPWVEDFGLVASGQSVPFYNRIIGVTSYGPIDTTIEYLGSSILDGEFVNLLNYACSLRATSC